jgi:hypothetical protein
MQIARAAEHEWALRTRKTAVRGGKPLSFQYVFRLFANPYYMGLIRLRNGEAYKGAHPPMVTPAEFEQAQDLLGRPGRTRPSRHLFAYAGLLPCGLCGRMMVPEEHVKRSGRRFVYYRCRGRINGRSCPNPSLPEASLEKQLEDDLRRLSLPREAIQWVIDNLRPELDATISQQTAQRSALEKALADARRESDLKLRNQVDDETFERRRLGLLDRQAKVALQLEQPGPSPDQLLARLEQTLEFSAFVSEAFASGDAVRRRQIFQAVCANSRVRDRKALCKANEPFSFFEGSGLTRSWWTIVEDVRTWLLKSSDGFIPSLQTGTPLSLTRNRKAA